MQLEAVEPAQRGLAAVRVDPRDLVLGDAGVLADAEAGRVDETDPGTAAQLGAQVDRQWEHDAGHELDEALVIYEVRELGAQVCLDMLGIEALGAALTRLLEEDQERHDLAGA